MKARDARGFTLIELAVVGVLATIVMLGLTAFYFNSQSSWLDGSTQALAQRDGTLLVERITRGARQSAKAQLDVSDPSHHKLLLYDRGSLQPVHAFWRKDGDELVHEGPNPAVDRGAVVTSRVARFQFTMIDSALVELSLLELRSETGRLIPFRARFALYNHE